MSDPKKVEVVNKYSGYTMEVRIWKDNTITFCTDTPGLHPENIQWSKSSLEKILAEMK